MRPTFSLRPCFLLVLICLALAGCRGQNDGPAQRWHTQALRIGTDATYPPFETVKNDNFSGFDIELGEAIAAEMGAHVQWVNTGFDGIFPALLGKKFDAVMSSVTITEERKKNLAFSTPYYTAGQIVAIRDDETGVQGLANLDGKTAGIQLGTTAAEVLKKYPNITVRKYPTIDLALSDLKNGNLDAVVGDAPTIRYFLAHGFDGLKTVGTLLTEEHYGVVMRPADTELKTAVDAALARLKANGKFAALENKYFGKEAQSAPVAKTGPVWPLIFPTLARGLVLTLELTFAALLFGLPFGLLLALGRLSRWKVLSLPCTAYIEIWRGTPLLVQIMFVYYALPQLVGLDLSAPLAGGLALCLNCAAYIAEIFRSGISSIDKNQNEAALSMGLTPFEAMRGIVLPQATQRVLPPLTNEAIALLKDSSLVSVIGLAELMRSGQDMASQLAAPIQVWPAVALMYLLVTFPLTRLAGYLEKRWAVRR